MEKILIVDDLPTNTRVLSVLLRQMGYDVATAQSGADALQMLGHESVGLVLLDLMMPEMNGMDVLRLMRADPRLHGLPVVIYSASDTYRDEALQLGAANFVMKGTPRTVSDLCEAIASQVKN